MRDLRQRGEVGDVAERVADRLAVDGARLPVDQLLEEAGSRWSAKRVEIPYCGSVWANRL